MTHSPVPDVKAPNVFAPKVSVIVPVYNTELYVERAIISLMEQTLDDVQFIIIDDGSKDDSLNIIKQVIARYPVREGQVTLISRENRGVAATRAQGMELATGDYIIHLDSDDWAELNWLEAMYTKAIEENADVVVCDYISEHSNRKVIFKQLVPATGLECAKQLMLSRISNSNCDKLVRRCIFNQNNINFHSGYDMGEDFLVSLYILIKASNVSYISWPLYHYNRVNENSLTKTYTKKSLNDLVLVTDLMISYIKGNNLEQYFHNEIVAFKMTVKATHISNPGRDLDTVKKAFEIYPELNSSIYSSSKVLLKLAYVLYVLRLHFLFKGVLFIRDLIR